jgi:hypothetical protein
MLLSYRGEVLSVDQTVGDIADPGVVIALMYATAPPRDEAGQRTFLPSPREAYNTLLAEARRDADLAAKLDRHLRSPDATLKARLELEG